MTTTLFPRKALIQYEVGAKVVMTAETFEALHSRSRSVLTSPSTTYIESLRRFIGKVGEVTHVFPPSYSLTVAFLTDEGDDALFHMDNFSVVPATKLRRLRIERDDDADSPRSKEYGGYTRMICTHRNYILGDIQTKGEGPRVREWVLAALRYLYRDLLPSQTSWRTIAVERAITRVEEAVNRPLTDSELAEFCLSTLSTHFLWLPLYLYDHSGITMNTSGFSCGWDSGQVGIIVVPKYAIRHLLYPGSVNALTKKEVAAWERRLKGEVETYDHYLTGACYGGVIETRANENDEWEEEDSCWGFYGHDHEESGLLAHFEFDPATTELIEP